MYRGGSSSFRQIGDHHGAQRFQAPLRPCHAPLGEHPLVIPPFLRGYRGGYCSPCRRHDFHGAEAAVLSHLDEAQFLGLIQDAVIILKP